MPVHQAVDASVKKQSADIGLERPQAEENCDASSSMLEAPSPEMPQASIELPTYAADLAPNEKRCRCWRDGKPCLARKRQGIACRHAETGDCNRKNCSYCHNIRRKWKR
eukprot:g30837.t1